jgi:hypothetical protein
MNTNDTCPHCGADGYFNVRDADWRYECHSSCNADGAEFYISEDCYKRQLAEKDAEIERLNHESEYWQKAAKILMRGNKVK